MMMMIGRPQMRDDLIQYVEDQAWTAHIPILKVYCFQYASSYRTTALYTGERTVIYSTSADAGDSDTPKFASLPLQMEGDCSSSEGRSVVSKTEVLRMSAQSGMIRRKHAVERHRRSSQRTKSPTQEILRHTVMKKRALHKVRKVDFFT